MNENDENPDELPPGHFWDSEKAEREYHAIERGIAEAEEQLGRAQLRLGTVLRGVYNQFCLMPGVAVVLGAQRWPYHNDHTIYTRTHADWKYKYLNHALNPYWLPLDGRVSPEQPPAPWQGSLMWQGCLVARSVERETRQGEVVFNQFIGGIDYRDRAMPFSYEGRVERYAPTGDVGISWIEKAVQSAAREAAERYGTLCAGLLDELLQEVHALTGPLGQQIVLTFLPDLCPTNVEEIHRRYCLGPRTKFNKKLLANFLEWPPLTRYEAPKVGARLGLASYKGICWVCCGEWKPYQFPKETLKDVWERVERIEKRLREKIDANVTRTAAHCEDEILLLRRRKGAVRIQHYKPVAYQQFWQAVGESTGQGSIAVPASAGSLQIPQTARSLPGRET